MTRAARAIINLGALRHNLQRVRQSASGSRVFAVVKADAYGHGMVRVVRRTGVVAQAQKVIDLGRGKVGGGDRTARRRGHKNGFGHVAGYFVEQLEVRTSSG